MHRAMRYDQDDSIDWVQFGAAANDTEALQRFAMTGYLINNGYWNK